MRDDVLQNVKIKCILHCFFFTMHFQIYNLKLISVGTFQLSFKNVSTLKLYIIIIIIDFVCAFS